MEGSETSLNHFKPKRKFLRKVWFSVQPTAHRIYLEQSQQPPQPPALRLHLTRSEATQGDFLPLHCAALKEKRGTLWPRARGCGRAYSKFCVNFLFLGGRVGGCSFFHVIKSTAQCSSCAGFVLEMLLATVPGVSSQEFLFRIISCVL